MTVDALDDDPVAQLSELIATHRHRRGLTQAQLAARLGGMSSKAVSNWETGKAKPRMMLPALEKVLGVRFVRDASGSYRAIESGGPPMMEGKEIVETEGEGGRVYLYFTPGDLDDLDDAELREALAAGRLAALRAAREIREARERQRSDTANGR